MKQLNLHLGVHKTATTHFQNTLERIYIENNLPDSEYISRERLRAKVSLKKYISPIDYFLQYSINKKSKKLSEAFQALNTCDAEKLIISEEDFLGFPKDAMRSFPYSNSKTRLNIIKGLQSEYCIKIFISIREYSSFAKSIYAQLARVGKIEGFNYLKKNIKNERYSWFRLIEFISSVFDKTEIFIWKYEDYFHNYEKIISEILPCNELHNLKIPIIDIPAETKSLSSEAIQQIEKLVKGKKRKDQIAISHDISQNDSGIKIFQPFSEREVSYFKDRYLNDIEKIKKIDKVTFLRF